jgi:hypothetical protein
MVLSGKGYIPETKLRTPETVLKRSWLIRGALPAIRQGALEAHFRKTEMRKLLIVAIATFSASASMASPVAPHPTKRVMITRIERCQDLQRQFNHAILEHAKAKRAAEARALQKRAQKYCAGKRQAQGIRAYAEALRMLGVQPIDR